MEINIWSNYEFLLLHYYKRKKIREPSLCVVLGSDFSVCTQRCSPSFKVLQVVLQLSKNINLVFSNTNTNHLCGRKFCPCCPIASYNVWHFLKPFLGLNVPFPCNLDIEEGGKGFWKLKNSFQKHMRGNRWLYTYLLSVTGGATNN